MAAAYRSAIGPGLLVPKKPAVREGVEPLTTAAAAAAAIGPYAVRGMAVSSGGWDDVSRGVLSKWNSGN